MKGKNIFGKPLEICNCKKITGWFRDGTCSTDITDLGQHTICCVMNDQFLRYSKAQGNDLNTPIYECNFPGLKAGDKWCLCASRWLQAYEDGMAPEVILESTELSTLNIIDLQILKNTNSKFD